MLSFSRKADYGLLFLSVLAKDTSKEYLSVKTISEEHAIPYAFLTKIATTLKEIGIIRSREGSGGGYMLADLPENIYLHDIVTELDGPVAPVACMRGDDCACSGSCGHKGVMQKVSSVVEQTLQDYSLADLIEGQQ